jgi:hypothetical protein
MLTYLDDAFDAPMPTGAISHLLAAPFDQLQIGPDPLGRSAGMGGRPTAPASATTSPPNSTPDSANTWAGAPPRGLGRLLFSRTVLVAPAA